MMTIQSIQCFVNQTSDEVHSVFPWSHAVESVASIELIYHIDQRHDNPATIPIRILFKQAQPAMELSTIETYLQFDSSRAFYSLRISDYFPRTKSKEIRIETIISHQTCQTSHNYLILSLARMPALLSSNQPVTSACTLKTIGIDFEELGLASFIIRPKQYQFTYCDGVCSSLTMPSQVHRSSIHSILQSILHRKHVDLPPPTCVPSEYADDQFLLRHADGTMNIYPIANLIVKQCACR
jgi:hypothetical protein